MLLLFATINPLRAIARSNRAMQNCPDRNRERYGGHRPVGWYVRATAQTTSSYADISVGNCRDHGGRGGCSDSIAFVFCGRSHPASAGRRCGEQPVTSLGHIQSGAGRCCQGIYKIGPLLGKVAPLREILRRIGVSQFDFVALNVAQIAFDDLGTPPATFIRPYCDRPACAMRAEPTVAFFI